MTILQHDKKLYELRNLGNGFSGHVPSPITILEGTPSMRWSGAKIPASVWREIVSFFQWSQEETESETQVRLLLNADTGEFKAWAFPQKYGTGMTAKELPSHEDYERQLNEQMTGGQWIKFGTVHHHCSMGAFQSGTDSADETEMGIHITLGNIGCARHSIHARVSLTIPGTLHADGTTATKASHGYYPAVLSDWFECPDMPIVLTENLREEIVRHILCTPVERDSLQFPPAWAENLIQVATPPLKWISTARTPSDDWEEFDHGARSIYTHNNHDGDWGFPNLDEAGRVIDSILKENHISLGMLCGLMICDPSILSIAETDIVESVHAELHKLHTDFTEFMESNGYHV